VIILDTGRWFFGILLMLLAFSAANASTVSANIESYPFTDELGSFFGKGEYFYVYGEIDVSRTDIAPEDLRIHVYDDSGDLIRSYKTTFFPKNGDNSYLSDGYFLARINIRDEGEFSIRLKIGDTTIARDYVEIGFVGDRLIELDLRDYSVNSGKLLVEMRVENMDSEDHDVEITLAVGGLEKSFDVFVGSESRKVVEKEIDLSLVGSDNFLLLGFARVRNTDEPELVSRAKFMEIAQPTSSGGLYSYGSLEIAEIGLSDKVFYPGDILGISVKVRNNNNIELPYYFEYSFDNQIFKKGDVSYIQAKQDAVEVFYIEVPDKDHLDLTVKAESLNSKAEYGHTFLISKKTSEFLTFLKTSDVDVNAGNNVTYGIGVINTGNQPDAYQLSVEGWNTFEMNYSNLNDDFRLELNPLESDIFVIQFEAPESKRAGVYPISLVVCGAEGCKQKSFNLNVNQPEFMQTIVEWDENQTVQEFKSQIDSFEYTFTIRNVGAGDKNYYIDFESDSPFEYAINNRNFVLGADKEREIGILLRPLENKDFNVTLIVEAQDEIVFEKEVQMNYVGRSMITGMFIGSGESWTPGLWILGILSLVGLGFVAVNCKEYIMRRWWTHNVINYRKKETITPKDPMPGQLPRHYQEPKTDFQDNSFNSHRQQ